jgi:hypothetical protein
MGNLLSLLWSGKIGFGGGVSPLNKYMKW